MELLLFIVAFAAITVSMCLYIGYAISRREGFARIARAMLVAGVTAEVLSLAARTVVARGMPEHAWFVPWGNWFESLSCFALVILLEFLVIQWKREIPILGCFVTPLAFITLLIAVHSPAGMKITPHAPALQSYWMVLHVPVMLIAYAAFANAFAIGIAYLVQEAQLKSRNPSSLVFRMPALDELDQMIYRVVWWALPVFTLGLLLGARWAYLAWGRYWGWDPKETSSFVTVLIYLGYLGIRHWGDWRGRKATYLSLAGFVLMILTYIGANYISPLHDFLSGPR